MTEPITFYTVGDARVFIGVLGLLRSLRAVGHDEPLVLLDAGFEPQQRRYLEDAGCRIVDPPAKATHPTLYKPFPQIAGADGIVVSLDCDALVTQRFDDLAASASRGRIVAFPDPAADRFYREWADIWGVRAPLRKQTYVSAGYLVFSTREHPDLLPRWWECCEQAFDARLVWDKYERGRGPTPDDQEALNALLMSEVPEGAVDLLPRGAIVHGVEAMSVRVQDRSALECHRDGIRVRYLHAGGSPKPWDDAAKDRFRPDAYNRLLRSLIAADDVPKAPWVRPGARGAVALVGGGLRNHARDRSFWFEATRRSPRLHDGLRRGLRTLRAAA